MNLSFLDQESTIAAFQDLIDLNTEAEAIDTGIDANIDIPKLKGLTAVDVKAELQRRGLQPKGFYSDDVELLQKAINDDYESSIEKKRQELKDQRIAEAKQAKVQHEIALIQTMIHEEKGEIMNDPRLSEWFRMIGEKSCPLVCRIDGLSNITARSLSKA
jgi:hypothetical protein